MTVSSTNPASDIYAALNGTTSTTTSKTADTQNRFLKLLTTQLKNQDPLNPVDNAQMTSQLAQISTVDGIERLNTTLQSLISDSSNSQAMQAAALVGHGVLVPGSSVELSTTNGTSSGFGGVELAKDADAVKVDIKDGSGQLIRTLNLGDVKAGSHTFSWDGLTNDGVAAAVGSYSFTVSATQGSNKVDTTALSIGLVSSVTRNSSGMSLNVGQQSFALSDVRQIL